MTASGLDLRVQPYKVAPDTHVIPQLLGRVSEVIATR